MDAPLIGDLQHLEHDRRSTTTTRNARLAAIHSLFRYAALRAPEHAALIGRVLALPAKRRDHTMVTFLDKDEADALLAAPDRDTWIGRRDHALLAVALQTGLRVSELIALRVQDVHLGTGPNVRCLGKGRKERCTPLTKHTVQVLRVWLAEHPGDHVSPLFPTHRGSALSRDAVAHLVTKHAANATRVAGRAVKHVTPHTLRHYVDGWVMWPVGVFPLAGVPRGLVPAT